MPMSNRPEFADRQKSPYVRTSPGIKRMESEIVNVITGNCDTALHTPGRDSDSSDDGEEDVPNWFSDFLNKDMDKMDADYFQHLLGQKETYPDNFPKHHSNNIVLIFGIRPTEEVTS